MHGKIIHVDPVCLSRLLAVERGPVEDPQEQNNSVPLADYAVGSTGPKDSNIQVMQTAKRQLGPAEKKKSRCADTIACEQLYVSVT